MKKNDKSNAWPTRFLIILLYIVLGKSYSVKAQLNQKINKTVYQISYPDTWTEEPGADNKQFTLKAPADSGVVLDEFVENINLVIETLPATYTAKEYADFSKTYLPQKIKKFQLLQSAKATLGKDSWVMEFKGIQFGKQLKWKQFYIIKGNKVHILTFTAAQARYTEYQKMVTAIIKSYIIK